MWPIDMAQVAIRVDAVADHLLQHLHIGEPTVALALPDKFPIEADLENTAGAGDQCHLTHFEREGREHLLRHPCCSQQPVALRAVGDDEGGFAGHRHSVGSPSSATACSGRTTTS